VSIGADIGRTKYPETGGHVLANVRDKFVQDVDESEGTGTWNCEEGVHKHVPIPTIAMAHLFRLASADAARRIAIKKSFSGGVSRLAVSYSRRRMRKPYQRSLKTYA
jgi:6-phosphogluconate dehydrogenase